MNARVATGWLLLFVLLACGAGLQAEYEYDEQASFADYSSWAWKPTGPKLEVEPGLPGVDPEGLALLDRRVRHQVELRLAAKGYRATESAAAADLLVSISFRARQETDIETYPVGGSQGMGPAGGWYTTTEVRTYTRGTLAITVADRVRARPVWHGWVSKRIFEGQARETREANVDRAVAAILTHFPALAAAH